MIRTVRHDIRDVDEGARTINPLMRAMGGQKIKVRRNDKGYYDYHQIGGGGYGWMEGWLEPINTILTEGEEL